MLLAGLSVRSEAHAVDTLPQLQHHAIVVNESGHAVDALRPTWVGRRHAYSDADLYQQQLDAMFDAMSRFVTDSVGADRRVQLFIHGGLETTSGTLGRLQEQVRAELDDGVYPVYLLWPSSLATSLVQEMFMIRGGKRRPVYGPVSSTWVVPWRLGSAIVKAPFDLITHERRSRADARDAANGLQVPAEVRTIYDARSRRGRGYQTGSWLLNVRTWPLKIVSTTVTSGLGVHTWRNLSRRAHSVVPHPDRPQENPAVHKFLRRLEEFQGQHDTQLTVTCHSMGAIVGNDLLERWGHRLRIDTLDYMGAATSATETIATVVPWLQAHPDATFRVVSLHPKAEREQKTAGDVAPRGSTLEWIDSFYRANGSTADDGNGVLGQRFGRWNVAVKAMEGFPAGIRDRVTLKAFGLGTIPARREIEARGDGTTNPGPQRHADMSRFKHWRDEYWEEASGPSLPRPVGLHLDGSLGICHVLGKWRPEVGAELGGRFGRTATTARYRGTLVGADWDAMRLQSIGLGIDHQEGRGSTNTAVDYVRADTPGGDQGFWRVELSQSAIIRRVELAVGYRFAFGTEDVPDGYSRSRLSGVVIGISIAPAR